MISSKLVKYPVGETYEKLCKNPTASGVYANIKGLWKDTRTGHEISVPELKKLVESDPKAVALKLSGQTTKIEADTYVGKGTAVEQKLILTGDKAKLYEEEKANPDDLRLRLNSFLGGLFRFPEKVQADVVKNLDTFY